MKTLPPLLTNFTLLTLVLAQPASLTGKDTYGAITLSIKRTARAIPPSYRFSGFTYYGYRPRHWQAIPFLNYAVPHEPGDQFWPGCFCQGLQMLTLDPPPLHSGIFRAP